MFQFLFDYLEDGGQHGQLLGEDLLELRVRGLHLGHLLGLFQASEPGHRQVVKVLVRSLLTPNLPITPHPVNRLLRALLALPTTHLHPINNHNLPEQLLLILRHQGQHIPQVPIDRLLEHFVQETQVFSVELYGGLVNQLAEGLWGVLLEGWVQGGGLLRVCYGLGRVGEDEGGGVGGRVFLELLSDMRHQILLELPTHDSQPVRELDLGHINREIDILIGLQQNHGNLILLGLLPFGIVVLQQQPARKHTPLTLPQLIKHKEPTPIISLERRERRLMNPTLTPPTEVIQRRVLLPILLQNWTIK